jgi:2-methylisocitrate lyase-like PEP mutase family enzyme
VNDLDDTVKRLKAYEAAGADVLYAPGIATLDQLKSVTDELEKPFNVLGVFFQNTSVEQFAAAGARRISIGSALSMACWQPLLIAGREMLEQGSFDWTQGMASGGEISQLLN